MTFSFEFDSAIAAHKTWLQHLEFHVSGIEAKGLDVLSVRDPNACKLGTWIREQGPEFSGLHNFQHLKDTHGWFHEVAAEVVDLAGVGRVLEAETLIKGQLADLSVELTLLLEAMKRDYHTNPRGK